MSRLFGTDGVRGVANKELTVELAMQLGQVGAHVLTENTHHKPKILVGCDTRKSGDMLAMALMAGICSAGADAVYLGVIPTPAVAYLARQMKADAGVVISASHNPSEFNGIKFFNGEGFKLSDELEDRMEEIIRNDLEEVARPTGFGVGSLTYAFDAKEQYINFITSSVPLDLSGMKIVVDCANGASYYTSPKALERLGADLIVLHREPDGTNINKDCGSTHMESLQEEVLRSGAQIGLAFDGDADRLLAVDEKGNIVDGDQLMAICGLYLREKGQLKKDTIVATVMSNLGFYIMAEQQGLTIEQTTVGDRYVLECMKEKGYSLGGEQSGHIIFLDENTTGDGLLSAMHLLDVMVHKKKPLSELASVVKVLPQVLVNAKVSNKKKYSYMEDEEIQKAIDDLTAKFNGKGRVLIRPSGTEPLVRVMIEGQNQEELEKEATKLADFIMERLK
ncbi:MAG: phosphoglucosamine mutase [Lachnospiraceae bacterium]|nr:phosphoglucosamine mutase [Lachnospiraceae bacterium]